MFSFCIKENRIYKFVNFSRIFAVFFANMWVRVLFVNKNEGKIGGFWNKNLSFSRRDDFFMVELGRGSQNRFDESGEDSVYSKTWIIIPQISSLYLYYSKTGNQTLDKKLQNLPDKSSLKSSFIEQWYASSYMEYKSSLGIVIKFLKSNTNSGNFSSSFHCK